MYCEFVGDGDEKTCSVCGYKIKTKAKHIFRKCGSGEPKTVIKFVKRPPPVAKVVTPEPTEEPAHVESRPVKPERPKGCLSCPKGRAALAKWQHDMRQYQKDMATWRKRSQPDK